MPSAGAYIAESGDCYLADAHFKAVQKLAGAHDADADALLAFVIAHEPGHFLLGEATCRMASWRHSGGGAAVKALERRWLQFNPSQRERILSRLREAAKVQETASDEVR
jgi:hypothetical protein